MLKRSGAMRREKARRGSSIRPRTRRTSGVLERQVLQGFRVIFGSARRYDKFVRRVSGIPGSLLWALSEIGRGAGMSVGDLSACMALHQTTGSNLVKALVRQGLVERARNPKDRRIVCLTVSAKGRRVLDRAPHPHAGLLADALVRLDERRLALLREGLTALVTEMRRASPKAAGETLLGE